MQKNKKIKITVQHAMDILDFFDNGVHDLYNKRQWEAFKKLRTLVEEEKWP
jgi:hypothetical protein